MKALVEDSKMATIYLLHKKTRLKRNNIKSNLDDLIKIGWVLKSDSPNPAYAVNRENRYVQKLADFFKETGYTT